MARPPAPPGPPPPNYRPPDTPAPPRASPFAPPVPDRSAAPQTGGIGPGAATAVAALTLLVGLVAGFFLGRAYDGGDEVGARSVTTEATRPPSTTLPRTGDTIPQQAPGTPPSTDLPPVALGTIEAPIPAGQAYVLGLYEIEVLGVERDAAETLAAHEPSNPAAPEGRQHVLVELAVRFTDAAGLGNPAAIPFFLSDGDGEWSMLDARCGRVPRPLADAGLLAQGDEAVGNVCFTVPAEAVDDLALGTESFSGPLYFALP
jgi:hypothetical protein